MMRTIRWLAPLLLVLAGCNAFYDWIGQPPPGPNPPSGGDNAKADLRHFASAEEFKQYFTAQVAADYRSGLRGGGDMMVDGQAQPPPTPANDTGGTGPPPAGPTGGGDESAPPPGGFSGTTTQEEGVQESDIIKNDGQYIYVLANSYGYISSVDNPAGSLLRIVQADPGEALQELSSVPLEGYGQDLYLLNDQIVVLTLPSVFLGDPMPLTAQEMIAPPISYYQPRVLVTVIDVADRANPVIRSTTWFEGDLSSSRMIDDVLHLVLVNYPSFFMPLMEFRGDMPTVPDVNPDVILPDYQVEVSGEDPVSGDTTDWTDVYYPLNPDGYGMTTVISLNVNDPAGFHAVGVVAYPGNIYASTEALYLTNSNYDYFGDMRQSTDIYKFAFTDNGPELRAVGSVPGRILNQYSMSEYQEYLRVATTVDQTGSFGGQLTPSTNNVYVLGEDGEALSIVGRAENLAPGEQIYAARFSGPRGYLVTFQQTDPLFTLDVSDATNPRVVGELVVPGFSTFIIEMDANHLLTVGQGTLTEGPRVIPQGVQLSLFDISDFAHPQLLFHPELIGEPDAWSEALYNPKALTYFAAQHLLALPVEIYNYGFAMMGGGGGIEVPPTEPDGEPDTTTNGETEPPPPTPPMPEGFRGLYVYRVTPENGFEALGRMSTDIMNEGWYFPGFTRGVFMNDNVFAATDLGVVGAPVTAVETTTPWVVTFPDPWPPADSGGGGTVVGDQVNATETSGSNGG